MQRIQQFLGIILIGAVILTACGRPETGDDVSGLPAPLTLEGATEVAENFFKAWRESNYAAMYRLISPRSQTANTQADFEAQYQNVQTAVALNGLESRITETSRQGTTAIIRYDLTMQSGRFGDIQDSNRIMRLIETPDGWRIVWSTMDIFPELAEGARLEVSPTIPIRGNIYDRNGQVLVEEGGTTVAIYMAQQNMPNIDDCILTLSDITHRSYNSILVEFQQYTPVTIFFAAELDAEIFQANQQRLAQICGVGEDDVYTRTSRRYYNDLATHIVGYVSQIRPEQAEEYAQRGYPQDALVGQEGIEKTYEEELAGQVGGQLRIVGPAGEELRVIAETPSMHGQDIYLTIDRDLQAGVEQALVEAYNNSQPTWAPNSSGAAAVVMNVKTGEILAMASYPDFRPGVFQPEAPSMDRLAEIQNINSNWRTPLVNRATAGLYPAGSVFKIVSLAAGLDSGVYDKDRTTDCDGRWEGAQYGDSREFRTDWKEEGHGPGINARLGLTYSCDPYFWDLGLAMFQADPMLISNYAKQMGLGVATGLDALPTENGHIPNPTTLSDELNLVIGQGDVQITPLQITRMVAAIANRGTLYQPLLVSKIQPRGGSPTYVAQPTASATLNFKPEVFDIIQGAMCDVTTVEDGTARFIFEEWYNYQNTSMVVCGKTGTAQIGGEDTPPLSWFVAFVPQNDPEIAITVIVERSCEGSEVAAPITRRIIEEYYHMSHSSLPELWQTGCQHLGE